MVFIALPMSARAFLQARVAVLHETFQVLKHAVLAAQPAAGSAAYHAPVTLSLH
jgi:hypothetical protein